MQTKNFTHVRMVRDLVQDAINQLAIQHKIDLNAIDAAVGIAMALNDLIRTAPDSATREALAASVIDAIKKAGKASIVVPPRSLHLPGHA